MPNRRAKKSIWRICAFISNNPEKAIKALLINLKIEFPYVHDIAELLTLLEKTGLVISEDIKEAERLTRFAVFTRYPGVGPQILHREYEEALLTAEKVIGWVEERISTVK